MREIKFRAKAKYDNNKYKKGQFIKGYLVSGEETYIITEEQFYNAVTSYRDMITGSTVVDKETLGQYTGLKDKNGVEIYEGDVVSCDCTLYEIVFGKIGFDSSHNGLTGFGFKNRYVKHEDFYEIFYHDNFKYLEVVGNKYDNPELGE